MNTNAEQQERAPQDLNDLATRISEAIRSGDFSAEELQTMLSGKATDLAQRTRDYVQEHPWEALGMAVGAGVIVGLLMQRR